jgi:hypothetical protein
VPDPQNLGNRTGSGVTDWPRFLAPPPKNKIADVLGASELQCSNSDCHLRRIGLG